MDKGGPTLDRCPHRRSEQRNGQGQVRPWTEFPLAFQVQIHRSLNGSKYGIGELNPSGPRDPTRSSSKCK